MLSDSQVHHLTVPYFPGTLIAPQILHRVCHGRLDPEPWQKARLTLRPAILHGFRRHRVRGADYPGIVPVLSGVSLSSSSSSLNGVESVSSAESTSHQNSSVLGSLVSGLTDADVYRLDKFEGLEYEKRQVHVRVLRSVVDYKRADLETETENGLKDVLDAARADMAEEGEEIEALTYVWVAGRHHLEDAEWDFESFKRDKMRWWVESCDRDW
jgi:Gamma-glutamyl cyclotransferase, AIG2-like